LVNVDLQAGKKRTRNDTRIRRRRKEKQGTRHKARGQNTQKTQGGGIDDGASHINGLEKTRKDKTRQDKTRQEDKTKQNKTKQDKQYKTNPNPNPNPNP
jgi:hypothetical protein